MANTNNSLTADIDKALQQLQSFGLFFNKKPSYNLQNTTKNNDLDRINSDELRNIKNEAHVFKYESQGAKTNIEKKENKNI